MTDQPWTEGSVPAQTGRTAVVTGANTGLGFETARVLAARGASVVLAVRDLDKGRAAADRISAIVPGADVTLQRLDLGSLESVRTAAAELRARHPAIDLLVNNAGVMNPVRSTTADGIELHLGVNHLGPFALTGLLLDRLLPVAGSRVVTLSSLAHRVRTAAIRFGDLQGEHGEGARTAYPQSKLANVMFTYELQRRLAAAGFSSTIALAAHPGLANTDFGRNLPGPLRIANIVLGRLVSQPAQRGALAPLRAATDPAAVGGQLYGPGGFRELGGHPVVVESTPQAHDADQQRRLWAVSEELTGVSYPI